MAERAKRLESHICGKGHYPFSSRITCGHCGKNFIRHPLSRDKYEWVCRVHSTKGTACCPMRGISEEMLERLTAEAMGMQVFDGGLFKEQVAEISVPAEDRLVYHFFDGHTATKTWVRPRKKLRRFRKGERA